MFVCTPEKAAQAAFSKAGAKTAAAKVEAKAATAKAEAKTTPGVRSACPAGNASPSVVEWPRWVDPGDEGATMVETYQTMKALVPWLRQALPAYLKKLGVSSSDRVETAFPLAIRGATEGSALSSYKETWTPDNCKVAMEEAGMYEAGGSLMWLDPGFVGAHVSMLHAEPAWSVVVGYQKQFFSREACAEDSVGVTTTAGLGRLLFPCSLEAYCDDETRDWSKMPSSLSLLGGQPIVFAWYVAAARALMASDDALLVQLWQAALTCTVRVQVAMSPTKLALSSVEASERYAKLAEMSDTFIQWATKVQRIVLDMDVSQKMSSQMTCNQLRDLGVRYRGTAVTKTMVLSVGHVHELFDDRSLATLRRIDREFGRDLLSTNYTKLSRFMSVVRTHALSVTTPGKIKDVP